MSEAMWFWLGVLCGGALLCLPKGNRRPMAKSVSRNNTRKEWGQTRNFLYYDGTPMPIVKEDLNE